MSDKLVQSGAARWGLLVSLVAVLALISGLCLPGCSENPATSQTTVSEDETSLFDLPFDEVEFSKRIEDPASDVEILVGEEFFIASEGGTMTVGTPGNSQEFTLLPYAISQDTLITVEITKIESKLSGDVSVVYDFQPDGLVFAYPAVLRFDVAKVLGPKATSVSVYYLNESFDAPVWVLQDVYLPNADNEVEIIVPHFSRWGID